MDPGTAKLITSESGTTSGKRRTISLGRRAKSTRPATTTERIGVREVDASSPMLIRAVGIHQRRFEPRARATPIGIAIAKRTPSAIGCCAGPMARMTPRAHRLATSLELEKRQEGRGVVEDVEVRSLLHDCGSRDERNSPDEEPRDGLDCGPRHNHANDEEVDEHEGQEKRNAFQDSALKRYHAMEIDQDRAKAGQHDHENRCVEWAPAEPNRGIDQERPRPGRKNQGDDDPVGLEPYREVHGKGEPSDRDEEHDGDHDADHGVPAEDRPMPRDE